MKLKALLVLLSLAAVSSAVEPKVTYRLAPGGFRGDSAEIIVRVRIPADWHIQSNAPLDSFLIPTQVRVKGPGLKFGSPVFPRPIEKDFPALGGKAALFTGNVDVRVPVRRSRLASSSALEKSTVVVRYQACNDVQCLPPREVTAKYEK